MSTASFIIFYTHEINLQFVALRRRLSLYAFFIINITIVLPGKYEVRGRTYQQQTKPIKQNNGGEWGTTASVSLLKPRLNKKKRSLIMMVANKTNQSNSMKRKRSLIMVTSEERQHRSLSQARLIQKKRSLIMVASEGRQRRSRSQAQPARIAQR